MLNSYAEFAQRRSAEPWLLVLFTARYCSYCKIVAPQFERAASVLSAKCACATIDGSVVPEAKEGCDIEVYPTIILFRNGERFLHFP